MKIDCFLGPAQGLVPWVEDPSVTDLLIVGTAKAFVEKEGRLQEIPNPFARHEECLDFIERILLPLGKRIDASAPYLDARLPDGSRVHIILSPIAVDGPHISVRKFAQKTEVALEQFAPGEMILWLKEKMKDRKNILISGATGSGKTTLLRCLLEEIPSDERIIVMEESREIRLDHPHVVHLEARTATPDGKGEVTLRDLLKNALRMRPDRIIIGECRGGEAYDMLQAMSTGHSGSLGTLHANSASEALKRLEALVLVGQPNLAARVVREWIGHSIDLVLHLERLAGRQITEVLGVAGIEGEVIRVVPYLGERYGRVQFSNISMR